MSEKEMSEAVGEADSERVDTIEKLEAVFGEVLELADEGVIRTIVYSIVGNALKLDPVWLILVGPPSGGKSELLQATYGLEDYCYPISSITSKTFASGMVGVGDASLLKQIQNKTMVMKDFTTFTEGNRDELKSILAQMREIYDGRFDKMFGTGKVINWEGHVGCLGAITNTGVKAIQEHSSMGERFIFYTIKQPDRKKAQLKATENREKNMMLLRDKMLDAFTEFVEPILSEILHLADTEKKVIIEPEFQKEIMELANFATDVRSSIKTDWKTGEITYIPDKEMPMRFQGQLFSLAAAAMFVNKSDKLSERDKNLIRQIAFASIPDTRLELMKLLTKYHRANTTGLATSIHYSSGTTRELLFELVGLRIVKRIASKGGSGGDKWEMEHKYKKVMSKYFNVPIGDSTQVLEGSEDDDSDAYDNDKYYEEYNEDTSEIDVEAEARRVQEIWDSIPDNKDDE